jgi:hypothetical protein
MGRPTFFNPGTRWCGDSPKRRYKRCRGAPVHEPVGFDSSLREGLRSARVATPTGPAQVTLFSFFFHLFYVFFTVFSFLFLFYILLFLESKEYQFSKKSGFEFLFSFEFCSDLIFIQIQNLFKFQISLN